MTTDLTGKLSLNEMLRIFIPGIYFTIMLDLLLTQIVSTQFNLTIDVHYKTVLFVIVSLIIGLLISSLDLPKKLWFFRNAIPVNQLMKCFKHLDQIKIKNEYFKYYDREISKEFKIKTELDSGYYHLCTNISIISILFFLFYFIFCLEKNGVFYLNFLILTISIMSAISLFNFKVLNNFNRQKIGFQNSDEFKALAN